MSGPAMSTTGKYIVIERTSSGSTGETFECNDRDELFAVIQFLADEESTWTVTRDGKPVTMHLEAL